MTEEPDSLVLRYLRRLDEKFDRLDARMQELNSELRAIKLRQIGVDQEQFAQDDAIANLRTRLDRVERRLDLSEDAR